MTGADCESSDATEQSLAALLGIDRTVLHMRCRDFDLDNFYDREWGPASELPCRVLDVEVEEPQYPVYYFHATRQTFADLASNARAGEGRVLTIVLSSCHKVSGARQRRNPTQAEGCGGPHRYRVRRPQINDDDPPAYDEYLIANSYESQNRGETP